jgi:transcriptional regulator with XRE-family HTH domain
MNVREYRQKQGLSQEDLSELTGLHRTYIGSVERGERNISLLNIDKLAKALKVSISTLTNERETDNGEI